MSKPDSAVRAFVDWLQRCLLCFAGFAVVGCSSMPGRPAPGPEVPRPDAVMNFAALYGENCAGCHGANGVNGPSYPLANPVYQSLVNDKDLQQVIANGASGTLMPAFASSAGGSLTDAQIGVLVKAMRSSWYRPDALSGATPPPYRASEKSDTAHGAQVYATYCASCHGAAGATGKSKAGSITDPDFLSLVSDQALRTIVIAGRPDIGQPDWRNDLPGHPMSDREVTDVVGWLSTLRTAVTQATPPSKGGSSK